MMSRLFDFYQIVGKKTRVCLAEMLCQQYHSRDENPCLIVKSNFMDETTGRRLAGIIFQRFDVLDASPYEPLFMSYCTFSGVSEYVPASDWVDTKEFNFNPRFYQLLKLMEPKEFEEMISELNEPVDEKMMLQADLRFEQD